MQRVGNSELVKLIIDQIHQPSIALIPIGYAMVGYPVYCCTLCCGGICSSRGIYSLCGSNYSLCRGTLCADNLSALVSESP